MRMLRVDQRNSRLTHLAEKWHDRLFLIKKSGKRFTTNLALSPT